MKYSVKFDGKAVELPKFTVGIQRLCADVIECGKKYNNEEINAESLLEKELEFLKTVLGADAVEKVFGDDIDNIDINDVDILCCSIVNEYKRPVVEKQQKELEQKYAPIKRMLNEKGLSDVLSVAVKAQQK